jgi:pimeloyl-ACP methyl ester carboxylesterase
MEIARNLRVSDGTSVAYRLTPAASAQPGRTLVLLHGLASNLTRWSEFVEQTSLTARWNVLRVDLRGHGDSPTRGRIGLERWCGDLAAILDREAYSRAVLVGHSLGAQVALQFAARYPERTAGLILIDPLFQQALHGQATWLARLAPVFRVGAALVRALNAIGLQRAHLAPLDLRELDEMARRALLTKEDAQAFIRRYSSPLADLRSFRTAHYLQELVELFRPPPPPESIRAPVLLLLSRSTTFADPQVTRAIAARFLAAETVMIDAYHWPLTERPAEVRSAIEEWCARLEQT